MEGEIEFISLLHSTACSTKIKQYYLKFVEFVIETYYSLLDYKLRWIIKINLYNDGLYKSIKNYKFHFFYKYFIECGCRLSSYNNGFYPCPSQNILFCVNWIDSKNRMTHSRRHKIIKLGSWNGIFTVKEQNFLLL